MGGMVEYESWSCVEERDPASSSCGTARLLAMMAALPLAWLASMYVFTHFYD
jgi:hypothetical protein